MKQIGFIILVSISGLYAAHHLKMNHHPSHIKYLENRGVSSREKSAIAFYHPVIMKNTVTSINPEKVVLYTDQKQLTESDLIIHRQISNEIAVAGLSFINEEQVLESDQTIQDQFSTQSVVPSGIEVVSDREINDLFYSQES